MQQQQTQQPMRQQQPMTTMEQLEQALRELHAQRQGYAATSIADRIGLVESCMEGVQQVATDWVATTCEAKGIPTPSPLEAEEWLSGPIATIRYLTLLRQVLRDIQQHGKPTLPAPPYVGDDQRVHVPVIPVAGLYDRVAFAGFSATVRMLDGVTLENLPDHLAAHYQAGARSPAKITLILGAGNVSSIPPTDTFSKLFQDGDLVLLKMNPVNDYLGPLFEQAFTQLIQRGFLRIVYGGVEVGAAAVKHSSVDSVHITGSHESHERIVWGATQDEAQRQRRDGQPLLAKTITSELGNVSPWIIVPGGYSPRQLAFQARNVAASVTNNASFNCVATKVLITWKGWPDRRRFLDLLQDVLENTPRRVAYYPGARERFARFAGHAADNGSDGTLPWTLLRDVHPDTAPHLLQEESFVCVFAEVALDAPNPESFLNQAVDFANERLFGTLSVALTIPPGFRHASNQKLWQDCLNRLRFGTIGINHWPAIVYALMSPPWGGLSGRHA